MTYTKHDWAHLETLSEANVDHIETQYDEVVADYKGGFLTPTATIPMGSQSVTGLKSINTYEIYSSAYPTLQTAIDAAKGKTLILDRHWSLSYPIMMTGSDYNFSHVIGMGEGVITVSAGSDWSGSAGVGVFRVSGRNVVFSDFTIAGRASGSGLDIGRIPGGEGAGVNFTIENMIIRDVAYGLRLRDYTYYCDMVNTKIYDNIFTYSIFFDDAPGGSEDNGQMLIENCEMDGGMGPIWRYSAAATRHRIVFNRDMFGGAWSAVSHGVDLRGMGSTLINGCDFELQGDDDVLHLDGNGCNIISSPFSVQSGYTGTYVSQGNDFGGGTNSFFGCIGTSLGTWASFGTIASGDLRLYGTYFEAVVSHKTPLFIFDDRHWRGLVPPAGFFDDFIGRTLDDHYWSFSGSSSSGATYSVSSDHIQGEIVLRSGTTSGSKGILSFGGYKQFNPSQSCIRDLVFATEFTQSGFTSQSIRIGLKYDDTHYIMFASDAGGYWHGEVCNGGSPQSSSCGQSPKTGSTSLIMILNKSGSYFVLDNSMYWNCQLTGSAYDLTHNMEPYLSIETSDIYSKDIAFDYVYIVSGRKYYF